MNRKRDTVYTFLVNYIQDRGYAPNAFEIAAECGISQNRVCECLDQLEAQGRIRRLPNKPRSTSLFSDAGSDA